MNKSDFLDLFNKINSSKTDDSIEDQINSNKYNSEICKKCKKDSIILDSSTCICKNCGYIQDKQLCQDIEWRFYGDNDNKNSDPTRCGLPTNPLLPVSSLGSVIGKNKNFYSDWSLYKMKQYHQWNSMPYKERSLYQIFNRIKEKAKKAGIPSIIIEDAKNFYKQLSETRISRGMNRNGLEAASIYMACKLRKVPRSPKEISTIFGLKISDMTKGNKKFSEIMNLTEFNKKNKIRISAPVDFIDRYCSNLNLDNDIIEICKFVANKVNEHEIASENTPCSIAAGCIFLVVMTIGLPITKKKISIESKTSQITISKVFKKIYVYRYHLLPKYVRIKI